MPMEKKVLSLEEKEMKKKMNRRLKLMSNVSDLKNGFGKAPKCGTRIKVAAAAPADSKKKK